MQRSYTWIRYKEEGSWDTPMKSIWGQLSFTYFKQLKGRHWWSLGLMTFMAVLYKCCNVLNADLLNKHSMFIFVPLYTHNILQNRCYQSILQRRKPGLQKIQLHIRYKLPRIEVTSTGAKLLNVPLLIPRPVILWGGAILCVAGCWAASLALTYLPDASSIPTLNWNS